MIKSLLIGFVLFMCVVIGYAAYNRIMLQPPNSFINENTGNFEPVDPEQSQVGLDVIEEVNIKNREIQNYACEQMVVYTWYKGLRLKLDGKLYFEKPLNLKMDVKHLMLDNFFMGSNDEEFWFWSRHLVPPALYYAKHSEYHKTRLKSVFNPLMIMDSLGFKEIYVGPGMSVKDLSEEDPPKIAIVEKTMNSVGEPIGHMTFLDRDKKRLIGHLVTDAKGEMLASAEILAWENDLPLQILYSWYEEDQAMLIELPGGRTNEQMDQSYWVRPRKNKEINMGETTVDYQWDFSEEE